MVDLAVRPDIGMATIGMLDIPMEVVRIATRRRRMREPLIPLIVQVTVLSTPRSLQVLQCEHAESL